MGWGGVGWGDSERGNGRETRGRGERVQRARDRRTGEQPAEAMLEEITAEKFLELMKDNLQTQEV